MLDTVFSLSGKPRGARRPLRVPPSPLYLIVKLAHRISAARRVQHAT
jgi:hypothetical protein